MTLPTRDDGGIDWDKLKIDGMSGHPFVVGSSTWGIVEFALETAAHTRERCAKWHDGEVATLQKRLDADTETALALILEHKQSAAAIRKMED